MFREDCSPDEFIDVICKNRVYLPCLYVYNKIDQISMEEVDKLARQPHSVVVSCNMKLNLDYMLETIWNYLSLIQVYTKKRGRMFYFLKKISFIFLIKKPLFIPEPPDFEDGLIMRRGSLIEHVCHTIHRTLASEFKYALVWVCD